MNAQITFLSDEALDVVSGGGNVDLTGQNAQAREHAMQNSLQNEQQNAEKLQAAAMIQKVLSSII